MDVLPSIDLRGGRAVRLVQGDFSRETVYDVRPLERLRAYAASGARRVHVVDLDAAAGAGENRRLIETLVRESNLEVQVAGGVRTGGDVAAWLALGAVAVVMGTTAVRDPERLAACAAAHPGRVIAALDMKDGRPAVRGWAETSEVSLPELMRHWEAPGIAGVILTSVDRDGTAAGPDLDTLQQVLGQTALPVVYSGGISGLDDIKRVADAGAAGVILGTLLYRAGFRLEEALAAC